MNNTEIQSQMKSIEENIAKETERLNKLRSEMDKPEKLSIEEMCKGVNMSYIDWNESIDKWYDNSYIQNAYLSRERAEKEALRIKLSVIADYLNGGLFEPKNGEMGYSLYLNRNSNEIAITGSIFYSFYGQIFFKTCEHAELAKTYFSKDELIKMLR